jgi:cell division septation protein DedD
MLRTSESETEILLGNKHLLGIFFVVAILLGIAFTGGYMVGRGSSSKKASNSPPAQAENTSAPSNNPTTGGETHSVPADSFDAGNTASNGHSNTTRSERESAAQRAEQTPLGTPKRKSFGKNQAPEDMTSPPSSAYEFTPQDGQTFLQVAAVGRDEATAIAEVLHKKGFHAHSVPKPGSAKLYRVLIGPVRDAGDLSTTRDALHKTGFREVIVQRY